MRDAYGLTAPAAAEAAVAAVVPTAGRMACKGPSCVFGPTACCWVLLPLLLVFVAGRLLLLLRWTLSWLADAFNLQLQHQQHQWGAVAAAAEARRDATTAVRSRRSSWQHGKHLSSSIRSEELS